MAITVTRNYDGSESVRQDIDVSSKFPDNEKSVNVSLGGVTVTIIKRSKEYADESGKDPEAMLVFIDTDPEKDIFPISVKLNDDEIFEGDVR